MPRVALDTEGNPLTAIRKCVSLDAQTIARVEAIESTVPGVGGFSGALRWAVAMACGHVDKTLAREKTAKERKARRKPAAKNVRGIEFTSDDVDRKSAAKLARLEKCETAEDVEKIVDRSSTPRKRK